MAALLLNPQRRRKKRLHDVRIRAEIQQHAAGDHAFDHGVAFVEHSNRGYVRSLLCSGNFPPFQYFTHKATIGHCPSGVGGNEIVGCLSDFLIR
jgi:hypothetical protein